MSLNIAHLAFELHTSATDREVWDGIQLQRRAVGDAQDDLLALHELRSTTEVTRIYARILASEVQVLRIYTAEARHRGLIRSNPGRE